MPYLILADGSVATDEVVNFQPNWIGLLIGVFLPIAVGLVTKVVTNASAKAALLLFFTFLNGFLAEYVDAQASGASYHLSTALYTWAGGFVIAVATHFGFWKPVGASAWAQRNLVK